MTYASSLAVPSHGNSPIAWPEFCISMEEWKKSIDDLSMNRTWKEHFQSSSNFLANLYPITTATCFHFEMSLEIALKSVLSRCLLCVGSQVFSGCSEIKWAHTVLSVSTPQGRCWFPSSSTEQDSAFLSSVVTSPRTRASVDSQPNQAEPHFLELQIPDPCSGFLSPRKFNLLKI